MMNLKPYTLIAVMAFALSACQKDEVATAEVAAHAETAETANESVSEIADAPVVSTEGAPEAGATSVQTPVADEAAVKAAADEAAAAVEATASETDNAKQ